MAASQVPVELRGAGHSSRQVRPFGTGIADVPDHRLQVITGGTGPLPSHKMR